MRIGGPICGPSIGPAIAVPHNKEKPTDNEQKAEIILLNTNNLQMFSLQF